jgi:hypothetical protein
LKRLKEQIGSKERQLNWSESNRMFENKELEALFQIFIDTSAYF